MMERPASENTSTSQRIEVGAGALTLEGVLSMPEDAHGIVLLAQGSRNIELTDYSSLLAPALETAGLATLTVHLLTDEEEKLDRQTQFFRYNVSVLHQRIIGIANWLIENQATGNLSIGYFGNGPTGAAVLVAAAERPDVVHAIVVGNARIDLAEGYLERVLAPTCLMAGEKNTSLVESNRQALAQIPTDVEANKHFETLAGSETLFESSEVQQKVGEMAVQWFSRHLRPIV